MQITYNDLSPWAFLRDSLSIGSSGVKSGFFRRDEHYIRNNDFYSCLLKLKERCILTENFDVFNLNVNGIKYMDIQTALCNYAKKRKKDYPELLDNLIKDVKNIVQEKKSEKLETLDEIVLYLREPSYEF